MKAGVKIVCLMEGANGFGAALLTLEHGGSSLSEALATGNVKGLIAFESDIPAWMLEGIPLVAVADWLPTETVKHAHFFFPTTAWVEMDGAFINNEGRAQRFRRVMQPGLPIKGLDTALHPPRTHRGTPPGGDVRPAWRVIAELVERLGGEKVEEPFSGRWEKLRELDPEGEGMKIWPMKCP